MNKTTFLDKLQSERDKFELLLNRVGFARQLTIKGVSENLSIKDLLADVLSREQFISDRLHEILHSEKYFPATSHSQAHDFQTQYGFPDYESNLVEKEKINHLVIYKYKNIALDEIISQELAAYQNIIFAFEKLNHNQCLDHDLYYRIGEHTYKPYRKMSLVINRWLKKIETESK